MTSNATLTDYPQDHAIAPRAAQFVWYELVTSDVDAALSFYAKVLDWQAQPFSGEPRYVIVNAKGRGVGGVMPLPAGMAKPFWLGYVGMSDVDAAVHSFGAAGGTIQRQPWDIPTVGRIALVSDPQGGGLALFRGAGDRKSEAFDQTRPGHGNWHELSAADPEAAFAFYSGQFGWTEGRSVPMGAMGHYQLFQANGVDIGGIMRVPGPTTWTYYFGTSNIYDAAERVTANGGSVQHGPAEVPGGAFIIQATDPQGARFALVGPAS